MIAKSRAGLGIAYYDDGSYPLAIIELNKSYTLVLEYGDVFLQAHTFKHLGLVYQAQGEFDKAREWLEKYRLFTQQWQDQDEYNWVSKALSTL